MGSLFPLIAQRNSQFGVYAADVLFSVLRTKDEYIAFRKQIVDIFLSEVNVAVSLGLLCC